MLEVVFKGLLFWLYEVILEGVQFLADALLDVFTMDTAFFEQHAPVILEMRTIIIGVGWALLLGNLAFQALRSMFSGVGFEAEDPKILFCRTAIFSFLLVVSPEICEIGMDLTSSVIALFSVPDSVVISTPSENAFNFSGSWLLVIIVGLIMCFQVIRLFAEVAERYVVTCVLTFLAPLAFGVGGSKSTENIFRGWVRMYGSMCLIMVLNVFVMKVLLSALATPPEGLAFFPWLLFIIGIARMGRRIDDTICRIGLNSAHTGSSLFPGVFTTMVVRQAMSYFGAGQENFFTKQRFHFAFRRPGYGGDVHIPHSPSMGNMQPSLSSAPPPARLGGPTSDADISSPGSDVPPPQGPKGPPSSGGPSGPQTWSRPGSHGVARPFPQGNPNIDIFPEDEDALPFRPDSRTASRSVPPASTERMRSKPENRPQPGSHCVARPFAGSSPNFPEAGDLPSSRPDSRTASRPAPPVSAEKVRSETKDRPPLSAQKMTHTQYAQAQHKNVPPERYVADMAASLRETGAVRTAGTIQHNLYSSPAAESSRPVTTGARRNPVPDSQQSSERPASHRSMRSGFSQPADERAPSSIRRKNALNSDGAPHSPRGQQEGGENAKNRRTSK